MNILLSNDDGIHAPGLKCLRNALSTVASVYTVAPDDDKSACSNALTLDRPLRARAHGPRIWSVNGTPVDCVHLGLTALCEEPIDMVVSGINSGPNLGDDVVYSGTVAAAMEGRFLGRPAIAVSLSTFSEPHYETAAQSILKLFPRLEALSLPIGTLLNINVPNVPFSEIQGVKITRLGYRHPSLPAIPCTDPKGRSYYWIGPAGESADDAPDTDFHAVSEGYISISPIKVDMTETSALPLLTDWLHEEAFHESA